MWIPDFGSRSILGYFGPLTCAHHSSGENHGLLGGSCFVLRWVHELAQRNSHVTRQQTADFLRVMPTLAAVNVAFNSLYNCMAYWFQEFRLHTSTCLKWASLIVPSCSQEQACLMDVRIDGSSVQLNGSFFNVADCVAIVVMTPVLLQYINPAMERCMLCENACNWFFEVRAVQEYHSAECRPGLG